MRRWGHCPQSDALRAAAMLGALALIANPELRALLLLTDALGLELAALLLATQLRSLRPVALPACGAMLEGLCRLASSIGLAAVRAYPREASCRPFAGALCLILVIASYGLRCGIGK